MERQYKESGIEWIGQIPKEWPMKRLCSQLIEIREKNYPIKTDKVLSLTIKDGVIPYEEKGDVGNKSKENHEEYKLAYPNTIVLNSMNILIGAVGISNYYGCVSPVYYVFKNKDEADLRYLNYIMSSNPFQKYLRKYANGILEIRLRVSAEDILKRHIPAPELHIQKQIADYLDVKCGEIDSLIGLQEQMIEKLKAYKQSVITEAVTKGLNPNAKLVPSGIDWIGEIPEGWKIAQMKRFLTFQNGQDYKAIETKESEGFPVYGSGGVFAYAAKYMYNGESVLFGRKGTVNKPLYVNCCFWTVDTMYYTIPSEACNCKFMYYVATTLPYDKYSTSTALPSMTQSILGNLMITIPPIAEQQAIASFLDKKCSEIDKLIDVKQLKIEKLKDYKKSVIYEAVTGKIIIE